MIELKCPKCQKYLEVDIALDQVVCACGTMSDVISDSWWDGEDDHAMWYLEVAEPPKPSLRPLDQC